MTTLADISNNLATQNGILDKSHDELTSIKSNIKTFLEDQKGIKLDELEEKIKARREAGRQKSASPRTAVASKGSGGGFSNNMLFAGLGGLTTAGAAGLGAMAAGAMTIGKIGAIAALSEPMSEFISGFAVQMLENTGVIELSDENQAKFQMNLSDIIQGGLIGLLFGRKGMIAGLVGGAFQKFILTKFDANNDEKITSEIAGIEINWTSPYLAPIIGIAMTTIAGALIKAVGRRMLLPAVATALGAAAYKMFGGDAETAKSNADAKKKFRAADLESQRAYEKYQAEEKAKARRAKLSLFRSADKTSMMNFAEWEAEQARIKASMIASTADAPVLPGDPDGPKAKLKTYIGQGLLPEKYKMTKTGGFMDMSNGGKFTSYDTVVADIESSMKSVNKNVEAEKAKAARIAKYAPMISKLGKIAGPLGAAFDLYEAKRIIQKEGPYEGISDEEQKKQLAGQISGAGGSIAFGALGAVMGTPVVPPFGTLGGGVLGAVLGSLGSEYLGEALASWIMSDGNSVKMPKKDPAAMALAAEAAGFTIDEFGALNPRSQAMIQHRYDLGPQPIELPISPEHVHPRAKAMLKHKANAAEIMPITPGSMAGMNSPMNLGIQGGDTYHIQGGDSIVIDSKSAKDTDEGSWFGWLPWK